MRYMSVAQLVESMEMDEPHRPSPIDLVDALLEAAVTAGADVLWLEPVPMAEHRYVVSIEQQGRTIATATLDAVIATAAIARFAILCELDLITRRAQSGCTTFRCGATSAEAVVTIRPTGAIRAEVVILRRDAAPPVAMGERALAVGDRVSQYRVLARLGSGGMGSVYKVEHVALGREFALKALHAHILSRDPDSAAQLLREARAAARIKHPNIVDVFDFGHLVDGRPYVVMELLPGTSLTDLIEAGPLEPRTAISIARQLAGALAAAHERGVIHADVSPSNVQVEQGPDGPTAKLLDFGLAQIRDEQIGAAGEASEFVFGTPHYISPEQIQGHGAEERSDQYSLGAILFEMLSGQPPYHAANVRELCLAHLRAPIPEVSSPHGPIPRPLVDIVSKCLQKLASARFPSMRALAAELEQGDRDFDKRGWRRWLPA